jgi:hypothetical protein
MEAIFKLLTDENVSAVVTTESKTSLDYTSLEFQEQIYQQVLNDVLVVKHPNLSYQHEFVKSFVEILEKSNLVFLFSLNRCSFFHEDPYRFSFSGDLRESL